MNKIYEYHAIANTYPMMSGKEYSNLVGSMEVKGFDKKHPILLYEDKILDGRNRYKAAIEANVKPIFEVFEGTFDEALEQSRQLNSFRRNIDKSQKAMVAAKEVLLSRDAKGKNFSVKKASSLHSVSEGYVKSAMQIIDKDAVLTKNVFDGNMTINEALYRLREIEALQSPIIEEIESFNTDTQDSQAQDLIQEFNNDGEAAASRIIELQDSYRSMVNKLEHCEENYKKLQG